VRIGFAMLILALLAGVVVGREKPAQEFFDAKAADSSLDLSALKRDEAPAPTADPFASRSFAAPAAPQRAAAPARPEAPLLPFRYIGKLVEGGRTQVLLLRGSEQYAAAPGDKLGSDYRLDKVTGSALTFTYLPLKTKQTLDIPK
jgi:hypothetical protein